MSLGRCSVPGCGRENDEKTKTVVSFGGGVNSGAMLIGLRNRCIRPDAILFADTGAELPETYRFVEEFSEWITGWGFPPIERVFKTYRGSFEGLEKSCLRLKTLPGLAFGTRSCSMKYKGEPLDMRLRKLMKEGSWPRPVRKAIGYDAGEPWRANKVSPHPLLWTAWYPLVGWNWDRRKCVEVLAKEGFTPPKSSCFFCPAFKKGEIVRLSEEHPEYAERALALESAASATTTRGLGGTFKWEEILRADREQMRFDMDENPFVPCGCVE